MTSLNRILAAVGENPGTDWGKVEKATPGVNATRRRTIRDRLLTDRKLVNIGKENGHEAALDHCDKGVTAHLHLASDPTIADLRPDPDEAGTKPFVRHGWSADSYFVPSSLRK